MADRATGLAVFSGRVQLNRKNRKRRPHPMHEEIEDLWSLAEECREWAQTGRRSDEPFNPDPADVQREFKRLADKLDEIAKRLAARMPT